MNFDLYLRLRQSIHHLVLKDKRDHQALIQELPHKLRVELSNLLYRHDLNHIPYFKSMSPHFVASVAPLLKPMAVAKGEYVYLRGDPIDGIYFLKKGETAYVVRQEEADVVFAINQEGATFGQVDFGIKAATDPVRQFSVKALYDVELLVLEKQDLFKIDSEFKNQIYLLFDDSPVRLANLKEQARKARAWIRQNGENMLSSSEHHLSTFSSSQDYSSDDDSFAREVSGLSDAQAPTRGRQLSGKTPRKKSLSCVPESRRIKKRETLGSQLMKRTFSFRGSGEFSECMRQILEEQHGEQQAAGSTTYRRSVTRGSSEQGTTERGTPKHVAKASSFTKKKPKGSIGKSSYAGEQSAPTMNVVSPRISNLSMSSHGSSEQNSMRIVIHPVSELSSPPGSPMNQRETELDESSVDLLNVSLIGRPSPRISTYEFSSIDEEEEQRVSPRAAWH